MNRLANDEIQSYIDELIRIDEISFKEFHSKGLKERNRLLNKMHKLLVYSSAKLFRKDSLPVNLDKDPYQVTNQEEIPLIHSYEKAREDLYILWDACEDLEMIKGFKVDPPKKVEIFIEGLRKVEPKNLALELTRDNGKKQIDSYCKGEISSSELDQELQKDHMSVYFSSYSLLVDYCMEKGIDLYCVGRKKEEYKSIGTTEKVRKIYERMESKMDPAKREELKQKYFREKSKVTDRRVSSRVLELVENDKTMLMIGGGHRPNLLGLLGD